MFGGLPAGPRHRTGGAFPVGGGPARQRGDGEGQHELKVHSETLGPPSDKAETALKPSYSADPYAGHSDASEAVTVTKEGREPC
ncbi:hypothetical protein Pen01_34460 [Phytomonospora endophytica]|nr:hypothetical protein Pen01_34460 [Phytomonospora endophytica]